MAKFIKIHNEEGQERFINMEQVTCVYPEDNGLDFSDGEDLYIPRQNEWNKVMKFVHENEYE